MASRIEICTPELQATLDKILAAQIINTDTQRELLRLVQTANAAALRSEKRTLEMSRSLSQRLANPQDVTTPAGMRNLRRLSDDLEEVIEKLSQVESDETKQKRQLASVDIKKDLASAVVRLDLQTANRMLDAIANLGAQLGQVESKIDRVSTGVESIQSKVACADATSINMVLSARSRNAPRTLALVKCSRELLTDIDFRRQLAQAFHKDSFEESKSYLEALQRGGVDFLRDFAPVTEEDTLMYFATPLWGALLSDGEEIIDWIIRTSQAEDLSFYPSSYLTQIVNDASASTTAKRRPIALKVVRFLVAAGVRRDANDYEAYRRAKFTALTKRYTTGDSDSMELIRNWVVRLNNSRRAREDREVAPFWEALAETLAPSDAAERNTVERRVIETFAPSRIKLYDGDLKSLSELLRYGGVRQVNGGEIEIAPANLQDGDYVRDSSMRNVGGPFGWTTVGAVRKLMAETRAERDKYAAMLAQ